MSAYPVCMQTMAPVPYTSMSWRRCLCGCLGVVDGVVVCDDGSVEVTGDIAEDMGAVVRH